MLSIVIHYYNTILRNWTSRPNPWKGEKAPLEFRKLNFECGRVKKTPLTLLIHMYQYLAIERECYSITE